MCIRDSGGAAHIRVGVIHHGLEEIGDVLRADVLLERRQRAVSYTHLRAHETVLDLVCRLLLEKKK